MSKIILVLLLSAVMLTGCAVIGNKGEDAVTEENTVGNTVDSEDEDLTETDDGFISAIDVVADMGTGWNLGNALDSCDFKQYTTKDIYLKKADYQIMAVYSNANWSGWDASAAYYIDKSGVHLEWNIDSLKSKANGACGNFSFQIINNQISDIGDSPVIFEVTKAQFITKNGNTITLEDMLGEYEMPLKDGVSDSVYADLTKMKELQVASDIIGGTLSIEVKITEYPVPKTKNKGKSAVEYYETLWGNPVTTKEMIDKVAEAGFKSVRIPITYYDHMDSQYVIDKAWLARVKEIVDYVLDNNMYCIINIHHDAGAGTWLRADLDTIDEQKTNLGKVWTQIAEYFKDYDEKLLFEGFNEILNAEDAWKNAGEDSYEAANQLNQKFVDTVRSTGGNNNERNLIVNTYGAGNSIDILDAFVIAKDSTNNHLIGGVHYYSEEVEDLYKIKSRLGRLNKTFTDKGIPVIIGEFSSENDWSEEDLIVYIERFMAEAKANNFAVYWWDRGGKHDTDTSQAETLLDRNNLIWYSEDLLKAVLSVENE